MAPTAPLIGTWFTNAAAGQRARLLKLPADTGGHSFILEYINEPYAGQYALPLHFHPTWTESFEILAGGARYRIGREERDAKPGEIVVMPPGVAHLHPWSSGNAELHVRHHAAANPPDLRGLTASLQAIVTIFGLAGQGRVNRRGAPNPLQLAVLAQATMPATYLAGLPIPVQRVLIAGLASLGRGFGYRLSYPEFGVVPSESGATA
jgi:mannose-6-phosphate isomerase-like protein (cupin superfamily)